MRLDTWLALYAVLATAALTAAAIHWRARQTTAGRTFLANRPARWGVFVLVAAALVAIAAPLVAPFPASAQLDVVALQNRPPSTMHLLGTDLYSRDVWSRLVFGARISLIVGILGMIVAVSVGTAVGAAAGYLGGPVDGALMGVVDVGLSVPRIFVLLVVAGLWDQIPVTALVLAIGLTSWFATSRIVRAEALSVREREYVTAARAAGAGAARIVLRHVLPNVAGPVIVTAALGTGAVMLLEAALSFLGIGVAPPAPTWGNMIADAKDQVRAAPWSVLAPGLAIALVVAALGAVGDGLRDAFDPRIRDVGRAGALAASGRSPDLMTAMPTADPAEPRS